MQTRRLQLNNGDTVEISSSDSVINFIENGPKNLPYNDVEELIGQPIWSTTHLESPCSLLEILCIAGDLKKIKFIRTNFPSKFEQQFEGHNFVAIHNAAMKGSLKIVKYLVRSSEKLELLKPNLTQDYMIFCIWAALLGAAKSGQDKVVNYLLNYVNRKEDLYQQFLTKERAYAFLSILATYGHYDLVEYSANYLRRHYSDDELVALIEQDDYEILSEVVKRDHVDVLILLISYIVSPEKIHEFIRPLIQSDYDDSLFRTAIRNGSIHCVKYFIDILGTDSESVAQTDSENAAQTELENEERETVETEEVLFLSGHDDAFELAIENGQFELLKFLLQYIDESYSEEDFFSIIYDQNLFDVAIRHNQIQILRHLVNLCTEKSKNDESLKNRLKNKLTGGDREALLRQAVEQCYDDVAKYLISYVAKYFPDDLRGMISASDYQAFRKAAKSGSYYSVTFLSEYTASRLRDELRPMVTAKNFAAYRDAKNNHRIFVVVYLEDFVTQYLPRDLSTLFEDREQEMTSYLMKRVANNSKTHNFRYFFSTPTRAVQSRGDAQQPLVKRQKSEQTRKLTMINGDTIEIKSSSSLNAFIDEEVKKHDYAGIKKQISMPIKCTANPYQYYTMLEILCIQGRLEKIKFIGDNFRALFMEQLQANDLRAIYFAAMNGHTETVIYLINFVKHFLRTQNKLTNHFMVDCICAALTGAAKYNHTEILFNLLDRVIYRGNDDLRECFLRDERAFMYLPILASRGHFELLRLSARHISQNHGYKVLLGEIEKDDYDILKKVIQNDHLDVLILLLQIIADKRTITETVMTLIETDTVPLLQVALQYGSIRCVKNLVHILETASENEQANNTSAMLGLFTAGFPDAFELSIMNGHLDVLEFLLNYVEKHGDLEDLSIIIFDHRLLEMAIMDNRLHIVRYLMALCSVKFKDNSSFVDDLVDKLTGKNGDTLLTIAAKKDYDEIAHYLVTFVGEHFPKHLHAMISASDYQVFRAASKSGSYRTVKLLLEFVREHFPEDLQPMLSANNCAAYCGAIAKKRVYVARYLKEFVSENCPDLEDEMAQSVNRNARACNLHHELFPPHPDAVEPQRKKHKAHDNKVKDTVTPLSQTLGS